MAEATAVWEQLQVDPIDDRMANESARETGTDFEERLVRRAAVMPAARGLTDALRNIRASLTLMIWIALVLASLSGAAAVRAVLGVPRDQPVNVFHMIAALIGIQTLLLVVWIAFMIMPRAPASVLSKMSLGGLVMRGSQWLIQRLHPGIEYGAAVSGITRSFLNSAVGRWTLSAISHALWLAFNVGCLGMMIFLLSTRQYAFAWETTILSERAYQPLTRAIAALPQVAGFGSPDDTQIASSMWSGGVFTQEADVSRAWSSLIVGSLIMYGVAPRLLLLVLCLGNRAIAHRRYRLDTSRAEYARLKGVLDPDAEMLGVIDPSPRTLPAVDGHRHALSLAQSARRQGLPAILGFELAIGGEQHRYEWPPLLHGVRWNDLGLIDSREDRNRVIQELSRSDETPSTLVIVCSLLTTPDRGVGAFLADMVERLPDSPVLVLTDGHRLRTRVGHDAADRSLEVDSRINDWRSTAMAAGIRPDKIVELDLEHLTQTSKARLAAAIGAVQQAGLIQRRIEQAFSCIAEFAQRVDSRGMIDAQAQANLHREIAQIYSDTSHQWRNVLGLASLPSTPAELLERARLGASRYTQLLPDRLRRSPIWLAAGASAGALGCVAAAMLISPIAIGSLPIWSGLGAAISAAVLWHTDGKQERASVDSGDADGSMAASARSAAMFALLLESQRFDERIITRILDQVIDPEESEPAALQSAADIQRWLETLRHRFDLAVARETRT